MNRERRIHTCRDGEPLRRQGKEGTPRGGRRTRGRPGRRWEPGGIPGKPAKEEATYVIRVEALAHAGRHVEPALQRAEPHDVWNVIAKKPQGPEPREERAGRAAFHAAFHLREGPSPLS